MDKFKEQLNNKGKLIKPSNFLYLRKSLLSKTSKVPINLYLTPRKV